MTPTWRRGPGCTRGRLDLDGQTVPVLGETPGATVAPALLSGHGVEAPDQVVLGALTLAQLHAHLGGTVVESSGAGGQHRLQVVGTATLPAFGGEASSTWRWAWAPSCPTS